jgi:alpha-ribazole phosphatase
MKLLLIRHPKPVIAPGICYGAMDLQADAQDLQRVVDELRGRAIPTFTASSTLRRASDLAHAMTAHHWPVPRLHAGLQEMNFGRWEGLAWDSIGQAAVQAWADNMLDHQPPEGESVRMLGERAVQAVRELIPLAQAQQAAGQQVTFAIFAHAGVLHTVPPLLKGEPLKIGLNPRLDYGAVIELDL